MDPRDRTPFEHGAAIRTWRTALLARGGLNVADVDELQDHLEAHATELRVHLRPEEAFWVAAHRIGTPDALTREYAKVRPNEGWLLRAQWALLGVLALWLLMPVANAVAYGVAAAIAAVPSLRPLAAMARLVGPVLVLVASLVAVGFVARRWSGVPEALERALGSRWLDSRWTPWWALAAWVAWNTGWTALAAAARAHANQLLDVPGMPAPLQGAAWSLVPMVVLNFGLPLLLFWLATRLQRQRPAADRLPPA